MYVSCSANGRAKKHFSFFCVCVSSNLISKSHEPKRRKKETQQNATKRFAWNFQENVSFSCNREKKKGGTPPGSVRMWDFISFPRYLLPCLVRRGSAFSLMPSLLPSKRNAIRQPPPGGYTRVHLGALLKLPELRRFLYKLKRPLYILDRARAPLRIWRNTVKSFLFVDQKNSIFVSPPYTLPEVRFISTLVLSSIRKGRND